MMEQPKLYKLDKTIQTAKILQHPEAFQLLLQLQGTKKRYTEFVCSMSKGWLLRRLLKTQLVKKEKGYYYLTPVAEILLIKLKEVISISDLDMIKSVENEVRENQTK